MLYKIHLLQQCLLVLILVQVQTLLTSYAATHPFGQASRGSFFGRSSEVGQSPALQATPGGEKHTWGPSHSQMLVFPHTPRSEMVVLELECKPIVSKCSRARPSRPGESKSSGGPCGRQQLLLPVGAIGGGLGGRIVEHLVQKNLKTTHKLMCVSACALASLFYVCAWLCACVCA
jgi:hypothetical protein